MFKLASPAFQKIFQAKSPTLKTQEPKKIEMSPKNIAKERIKEKAALNQIKPLPYIENIMSRLIGGNKSVNLEKPQVIVDQAKELTLAQVSLDEKVRKSPAYMSYYRVIREKIRSWASRNYYSRKKGETIISFTLLASGKVGDIYFGSGSTKDKTLRNIALKSIEKSVPFPPFPEELKKYSPLRFNVSIIFQK